MSNVFTGKDIEELLERGEDPVSATAGAVLTPSARDALRDLQQKAQRPGMTAKPAVPFQRNGKPTVAGREGYSPEVPDFEFHWTPGQDPQSADELERFFHSPEITALKERICDIGRRMWGRNYVDGNGGNITIRVGDNLALCTPTLISKGFIQPQDICLVDLDGNQKAGWRARTSEAKTHFAIMKVQPKAKACVHAHPPHGTAFAVAGVEPPTCLIPEAEVFLGKIGLAHYETPGSPENAKVVGEVGINHQAVLMANHGVITWGKDVEDAYWKMENVEAYLQTLVIAGQLGKPLGQGYGPRKLKEIIDIRKQLGMEDYRDEWKECELCDNSEFRPGFVGQPQACGCGVDTDANAETNPEAEAIVQQVTDLIMKELQGR